MRKCTPALRNNCLLPPMHQSRLDFLPTPHAQALTSL
jgi:hypothetical protein